MKQRSMVSSIVGIVNVFTLQFFIFINTLFEGYETYVVEDATKPIADSSARTARANMESKGNVLCVGRVVRKLAFGVSNQA